MHSGEGAIAAILHKRPHGRSEALISLKTCGSTSLREITHKVNAMLTWLALAALATEPPTAALLEEKPHGRDEALISPKLWKHIFCQGFYQLFWLFLIVYGATKYIGPYTVRTASELRVRHSWPVLPFSKY